ncbi:ricin-type beta-trefoil lectin domain protein [Kitasatospora paranensis]|uniref:Ricin-type beta-trefoil lectin domain protein n=1 Tax=Kitasatospora paranensis TaxID=258053 RepID=A0ABW2FY37_9ACTN
MSKTSPRRAARPSRRTGGLFGRTAIAATTALGLTILSAPAVWAATPTPTPSDSAPGTQQPVVSETATAVRAALEQAKAGGRPVVVDSLTTETSQTFADPDGHSLYSDSHTQDVRTKRNGTWQTLDTTLRANGDGTVTPAVTSAGLVLSGGGKGPLATITTADGKKLAVTAPFALPKPVLDGSTATYPSVLPDVDLQVTARPDGGWRDVIVVKTAQAAADPRLKSLHFPVATTGLKIGSDTAGNVSLTDDKGKVRVHAPTPFQWDSTPAVPPVPLVANAKPAAKSLFAAPRAVAAEAAADTSSAAQPGQGAAVSAMAVTATADELVLTPDQRTFGKGTGPWYLDPETGVDAPRQVNAQVQENHPDTQNVNTLSALGVGYCGYSDCSGYGRYRAYYQLGVPSQLFGDSSRGTAQITRATLLVDATDASAPGTSSPISLYSTPLMGGTTSWNSQPCGTGGVMSGCTKVGTFPITGTGTMSYDVKSWAQTLANGKNPNWTVGFAADNENEKLYRHHLSADPHIAIYYDVAPTIWSTRTTPQPGSTDGSIPAADCPGSSTPGWIGKNQSVGVHASTWSPIGTGVTTYFHVWDTAPTSTTFDLAGNTGALSGYNPDTSILANTGKAADGSVVTLQDGHTYQWEAQAYDGWLSSQVTDRCYFKIDQTPPSVTVTSADFPASGTLNATPKLKVNQQGTFTVAAADAAPATGLAASGVACTRWSDDPTPVTGWTCASDPHVVAGTGGTFTYTPTRWGTNTLFLQSMDVAGNYSQPLPYTFYAPFDPATGAPVPGDLTGDGRGDILLPDPAGNLRVMTTDNDPTTAKAAPLGLAPVGSTWKDVQTTHRGALRSMGVDDAFAWTNLTGTLAKNLYLYANQGGGTFDSATALSKPTSWVGVDGSTLQTAPSGWSTDWSTVSQILALGPLKAPLGQGFGMPSTDQTSLLAVEGGNLWLYRADTTDSLDAGAVKVSATGTWGNYDLIAPGSASGFAQPTLWSRSKSDGKIRSYTIKTKADGTLDLTALADPAAGTVILTGITTGSYPQVSSSGDANNDGVPDLWAIDARQHLQLWPGTLTNNAVQGFGTVSDQGDTRPTVDRLPLTGAANGVVADVYGKYPAKASGTVTFAADTVNGTATTVAKFAGDAASGVIDYAGQTSQLTVSTGRSFTISAWLKPNAAQGYALSTKAAVSSGLAIWPDQDGTWHFGLSKSDTSTRSFDETSSKSSNAARYQTGRWDKVTAAYNASTGVMTLYVNGALAGTAVHSGKFGVVGQLVVGKYQNAGAYTAPFNGSVSDVAVYDYGTDAGSTTGEITSDYAGKCVDVNNGVSANGRPVEIWDCNNSAAQLFTAQPNGTVKFLDRCLDAYNNGTANGTLVQLFDCSGNANQQWVFRPDGSILNPVSGRCLDLPNSNVTNGTQLQLYDCNQTGAQRWRSVAVVA